MTSSKSPERIALARWERILFGIAIAAVIFIPFAAVMALREQSLCWSWSAFISGMLALGAATLHPMVTLATEAKKVRTTAHTLLSKLDRRFERENDLIETLERECSLLQLEYSRERLVLEANQTRHRLGFLVGAIEQLGIAPAGAAAFIYAHKAYVENQVPGITLTTIFSCVVGLYVVAACFLPGVQELDQLSLAMQHAIERRRKNHQRAGLGITQGTTPLC